MQPRPSFDRALLIPIAIGVVSILGIIWIFLTRDLGESPVPPTVISSNFSTLAVQTRTPSASATPTLEETPPTATETGPESYPGPDADTPTSTSTPTVSLPTPSATPTPARIQPFLVGKYDDTHPNIAYDKNWMALKNPGTKNAYKGTIHASFGIGHVASFRFTGDGFRLGYQRGRNFGIVKVLIDGQPYSFHEQAFDRVWRSPQLTRGDHFVQIIHDSGEMINLDYIEILEGSYRSYP